MEKLTLALALCAASITATPAFAAEPADGYRIETQDDKTRRAAMRWETAFVILSAADLAITVQCIEAKKCEEANPIAVGHSTTKMIAIKSALTLGHFLFVKRLAKDNPKAALRFAQVSVGIQGSIVGLNIRTAF